MMVSVTCTYRVKRGTRDQMMEEFRRSDAELVFGSLPGCLKFEYSYGMTDPDAVCLNEIWETEEAYKAHKKHPMGEITRDIREKYVIGRESTIIVGEKY